ncbi:MAG TPA: RNA pyrophosphohydrolase [Candidatus Sulfotelmatobacter sp.]|nr:RNA pyrophosphohydrolase [Candidatus Sulfotelmatobacter sp.]
MTDASDAGYRRGVGIMLINAAGLVFVAQRLDMPSDAWQMPQGGIDPGEEPPTAAKRELREEIGTDRADIVAESRGWFRYDLPEDLRPRLWGGKYRGQTQKWFAMRFTGTDGDIDIATEHPEFSTWKWTKPATLPDLIVPFKRHLYRELLVEFKDVLPR